jgi:hypothetical protein
MILLQVVDSQYLDGPRIGISPADEDDMSTAEMDRSAHEATRAVVLFEDSSPTQQDLSHASHPLRRPRNPCAFRAPLLERFLTATAELDPPLPTLVVRRVPIALGQIR